MASEQAIPLRMLMECFYGQPWTRGDRENMLTEAARWGMNGYVYGPSGDPRTGTDWRGSYSGPGLDDMTAFLGHAADLDMVTCWRLSPSSPLRPTHGLRFSDALDRQLLVRRTSEVAGRGFAHVLVAFDDVEQGLFDVADREQFGSTPTSVATAHGLLARELGAALAEMGVGLTICPTRYWGTGADEYSRALADLLPPEVPVCWTGPRVTSRTIAEHQLNDSAYRDRGMWLWDNYPVNDWDALDPSTGEPARRRLLMAPLTGRDPRLAGRVEALLVNCGPTAAVNLPGLAMAAIWASSPADYDPTRASESMLEAYDVDGSLRFLIECAGSTPLGTRTPRPEVRASWDFVAGSPTHRLAEGPALVHALQGLVKASAYATHSQAPVVAAAKWYSTEVEFQCRAALASSKLLLGESTDNDAAMAAPAQWLADQRHELDRAHRPVVFDGGLTPLIEAGRAFAGAPVPPHDV